MNNKYSYSPCQTKRLRATKRILGIFIILSYIGLLGTVGGIETNTMTLQNGIISGLVFIVLAIFSTISLKYLSKY